MHEGTWPTQTLSHYARSPWLFTVLGCLFFVASATAVTMFLLSDLASDIARGTVDVVALSYLFILILSSLLARGLASYFTERWALDAMLRLTSDILEHTSNAPRAIGDHERRNRLTGIVSGSIVDQAPGLTKFLFGLLDIALLTIASLVALATIISPLLLLSYCFSILCSGIYSAKAQQRIKKYGASAENRRIAFGKIASGAWENLVIGNTEPTNRFRRYKNRSLKAFTDARLRLSFYSLSLQFTLVLLTYIPTFVVFLFVVSTATSVDAAATVVLIPRLLTLLSQQAQMISMISVIGLWIGRIAPIERYFKLAPNTIPISAPRFTKLSFTGGSELHPAGVDQWIASLPEKGYITVRGPNGSGKTTLLLTLKELYRDKAFYYAPTIHQWLTKRHRKRLSTGQKGRNDLIHILQSVEEPILLLDEWDAHLDYGTVGEIESIIKSCSQRKLIIDVRHREERLMSR